MENPTMTDHEDDFERVEWELQKALCEMEDVLKSVRDKDKLGDEVYRTFLAACVDMRYSMSEINISMQTRKKVDHSMANDLMDILRPLPQKTKEELENG